MAISLQWILTATTCSQFQRATLGTISEIRATKNSLGIISGDFDGNGLTDLAAYNKRQVLFQIQSQDSTRWHTVDPGLDAGNISRILAANCNSDKLTDLIVVDGKNSSIRIMLARYGFLFYQTSSIKFKDEVPEIYPGDINNDSKTDLLIYGKRENGITVYLGSGGGGFSKSTTLFPQKSFSALTLSDINSDKLNDIIAVDWLDNEVVIAKAFGKMKFSEPVTIHFEAEPQLVASSQLASDSFADIVISFVGMNELHLLKGDGTGAFTFEKSLAVRFPAEQLLVADMNSDSSDDIIYFSRTMRGIGIFLHSEEDAFLPSIEFSGGVKPRDFLIFPHEKSNVQNAAFVDGEEPFLRIVYNAGVALSPESEVAYALGCESGNVLSFDMIGNNLVDIAVLDKQSQAISLFLNQGEGRLSGKLSIPVPIRGVNMQYAIKSGSNSYFLVINPDDEQVAITEFNSKTFENISYTVPVQRNSELLVRYVEKNSKMLNFFLLSSANDAGQTSITKFSQIAPKRFIEQTIISRFEPPLSGVTMGDFDKDTDYDIAFMGKNSGREMFELRTITRDETSKTIQPHLDFVMKMKEFPHVMMWNADLTGDGYPDLIINYLSPINQLLISVSDNQQHFVEPAHRLRVPVNIALRSQLKIVDVNGDNKFDLVINNSLTKEIQAFWGAGNGTFPSVNRLISSEGIGGFTLADLDNDRRQELIVADSLNGWLKVIYLK